MTAKEKKYTLKLIDPDGGEIVYDNFVYERLQEPYRTWLRNLVEHGRLEPKR